MLDLTYVLGAVAFFAAVLGYVKACEHLGLPAHRKRSRSGWRSARKGRFDRFFH